MKNMMKFFSLAALVLAVTVLAGCQKDETLTGDGVHFTATVKMAGDGTKALDANGHKTFAEGDQIAVIYKNTSGATVKAVSVALTSIDIRSNGKVADFSVELNNPDRNQNVTYVYPAAMANDDGTMTSIAEQDGTLESLSRNLDYCFYNGPWNGSSLPANVTLANQLAILKLSINGGSSDVTTANVRQLTVSNGGNTVVVNRTPGPGPIYVAMLPVTTGDIDFIAVDNIGNYYTNTFSGKTLTAGHLYSLTVDLPFSSLYTPLTFEAETAGATVTFSKGNGFSGTVQYSTDGGSTWFDYSSAITLASEGDKVMFRGDNSAYYNSGSASQFSCSADCYIYGNIMSLVNSTGYPTATSVGNYAFREMFKEKTHIKSHSTKKLILPATTIGDNCYAYMFQGCTGLTTPPLILATTLSGTNCCAGMFQSCTGLTSVPELHVANLVNNCFKNMFNGCTNLTSVPSDYLPNTLLSNYCYEGMFQGCTNLASVPNLPATILKEKCYYNMFRGAGMSSVLADMLSATTMAKQSCESMFRECPNLTNTPTIAATTLAEACCNAMFYHSANITSASSLPATTLVKECYKNLFSGCKKLSSVTCYATDISAEGCITDWLNEAGTNADSPTLYVKSSMASADWNKGTFTVSPTL